MKPLLQNILKPEIAKQNLAAFAELPQNVSAPKAKAADVDAILEGSISLREGKLNISAKGNKASQAEQKAIAQAFAELPSTAACQATKAKPVSMEAILEDSLKTREGYTAPNIGKSVSAAIKSLYAGLKGAVAAGWSALVGLVSKPFVALANAKSNRAAFAELPAFVADGKAVSKSPSVDSILEDSLFLRDNLAPAANKAPAKAKPSSAKANKAVMGMLPADLAEVVNLDEKQALKALRQVNYQHFANVKAKQQHKMAGAPKFFDATPVPVLLK